jgi:hypothetical protein
LRSAQHQCVRRKRLTSSNDGVVTILSPASLARHGEEPGLFRGSRHHGEVPPSSVKARAITVRSAVAKVCRAPPRGRASLRDIAPAFESYPLDLRSGSVAKLRFAPQLDTFRNGLDQSIQGIAVAVFFVRRKRYAFAIKCI